MANKAVLSNRILISYDEQLYRELEKRLTYLLPSKQFNAPPDKVTLCMRVGTRAISIPIGRKDLIPPDYEIVEKRAFNPVDFPKFRHTLRPSQQLIYDKVDDNCIINANTAFGKTFTGIAIARKLQQKTLVITHTTNLRDQWADQVDFTMGLEPGVIGGGKVSHEGYPITVSNIQTLRKHAQKLRDEFGTILVDEVHHAPASVFRETLNVFKARYKIGLTATMERKDGAHVMLRDFFSNKVYRPPRENQEQPRVVVVDSGIPFSSDMTIPWARKVNQLMERPDYLKLVSELARQFVLQGHKVLVVADRTEFLGKLHEENSGDSVLVTGSVVGEERDYRHDLLKHDRNILFGTMSIYAEGISINQLSCVILATPINNNPLLDQLAGRVSRVMKGKKQPVIVDIALSGGTARRQAKNRAFYYANRGLHVTYADMT